jgi:hypothetical protein
MLATRYRNSLPHDVLHGRGDLVNTVIRAGRLTKRWSPFQHVGLVPAQPFRAAAAVIMLGSQ